MPAQLDTEEVIATTASKYKITDFTIDLTREEIHVSYDKLDSDDAKVGEGMLTLTGPDFSGAIVDASTIAGTDVYAPIKTALYNKILAFTGKTAVIS